MLHLLHTEVAAAFHGLTQSNLLQEIDPTKVLDRLRAKTETKTGARTNSKFTSCSIKGCEEWKVRTHNYACLIVKCPQNFFIGITGA